MAYLLGWLILGIVFEIQDSLFGRKPDNDPAFGRHPFKWLHREICDEDCATMFQ